MVVVPEKLNQVFEIASELYKLKQFESGMIEPVPFAYAFRDGQLFVFSAFGKHSAQLAAKLGIALPEQPST